MPRRLHIDFETFSKADLKAVGAYRYAYDPSTEILCAGMAVDDKEPIGWHPRLSWLSDSNMGLMNWYWDALEDPAVEIWAHNAMFEAAIMQALLWKTWGIRCPDLRRFRCTMSLARRAALPASLDNLGEALNLTHKKDKEGKALIKLFCEMQKPKAPTKKFPEGLPERRILPTDEPEKFAKFMGYCLQDVRAEQEVHRKLAFFDEPINNASYSLDAIINARGVTVNLGALRHAQTLIDEETEIVSRQFRELTGFEVTQNARL